MPVSAKDAHPAKIDDKTRNSYEDNVESICFELFVAVVPDAGQLLYCLDCDCEANREKKASVGEARNDFCTLPSKRHCCRTGTVSYSGNPPTDKELRKIGKHM
jgi:hypothetical protein